MEETKKTQTAAQEADMLDNDDFKKQGVIACTGKRVEECIFNFRLNQSRDCMLKIQDAFFLGQMYRSHQLKVEDPFNKAQEGQKLHTNKIQGMIKRSKGAINYNNILASPILDKRFVDEDNTVKFVDTFPKHLLKERLCGKKM